MTEVYLSRKVRREVLMRQLADVMLEPKPDVPDDLCDVIAACLIEWERGTGMAHDTAEAIIELVLAYESSKPDA